MPYKESEVRLRIFYVTLWKKTITYLIFSLTVIDMLIRVNVRDTHKDVKEISLG